MKKDFKIESKVNCLIIIIQQLIEGKHLTTSDIQKIIEKDKRTCQRYIKNLVEIGLPIKCEKRKYFYENIDGKVPFYLPKNSIYMIYLALISFSAIERNSKIVSSIIKQVELLLSPHNRAMLINFKENVVVKSQNKLKANSTYLFEIFLALMQSFSKKRTININYLGKKGLKNHLIEIYGFCLAKGTYYMVGRSVFWDNILLFRVDRIKDFYEENKEYKVKEEFKIKEYFKYALEVEVSDTIFEFKLEFYNDAIFSIKEREWVFEQEILNVEEGKYIFKGKTSSKLEIKKWILGYGADVKVIEPLWLKDIVTEEYKKAFKQYT